MPQTKLADTVRFTNHLRVSKIKYNKHCNPVVPGDQFPSRSRPIKIKAHQDQGPSRSRSVKIKALIWQGLS